MCNSTSSNAPKTLSQLGMDNNEHNYCEGKVL